MRQLSFLKDAALKLDDTFVSDHNRTPLQLGFERIESTVRTQRGGLRKYFRADKRSVSCSWSQLPETSADTVDAGMGAKDIEDFVKLNTGAFPVVITFDTGVTESYTMVVDSFDITLESRKPGVNLYSVSLSLDEV